MPSPGNLYSEPPVSSPPRTAVSPLSNLSSIYESDAIPLGGYPLEPQASTASLASTLVRYNTSEVSDRVPLRRGSVPYDEDSEKYDTPPRRQKQHGNGRGFYPWLRRVREHRWFTPVLLTAIFAVVFLVALLSFLGYRGSIDLANGTGMASDVGEQKAGVVLWGTVTDLDVEASSVNIRWTFAGCGPGFVENATKVTDCGSLIRNITIFANENATLAKFEDSTMGGTLKEAGAGSFDPADVIWAQNPTSPGKVRLTYTPQFELDMAFDWEEGRDDAYADDRAYPFDAYHAFSTFLAWDAGQNTSAPEQGTFSPFSFVKITGSVPNYVVSSLDYPTLDDDVRRTIRLRITRSNAVRAFAIVIFITNWAITLVILYAAILASVYRKAVMGEVFVVTITALFALPVIRDAMPGAPSFGTYSDALGYFLCLPIVAVSSAILLMCMLHPPKDTSKIH